MLTFLEFYEVLLSFVNFKLYHSIGMTYPPKLDKMKVSRGETLAAIIQQGGEKQKLPAPLEKVPESEDVRQQKEETRARLSSLKNVLQSMKTEENEDEDDEEDDIDKEEGDKVEEDEDDDEEDEDDDEEDEEEDGAENEDNGEKTSKEKTTDNNEDQAEEDSSGEGMDVFADDETTKLRKRQAVYSTLFKDCVFWLSREVPRESLEFVISCFGGTVFWDGSSIEETSELITHQVIDRPKLLSSPISSREYIQPQWVYDSINTRVKIPVEAYGVGAKLPPHLSPFVDDVAQGYVPEYSLKLSQYHQNEFGEGILSNVPIQLPDEDEEESDDEGAFEEDLEAEKKGKYDQPSTRKVATSKKALQKREEAIQKETAESLLPTRRKRLLERIKYSKRMKEGEINKLETKKSKLISGRANINSQGIIMYTE
eukprot:TRINITY_DN4403_c0_g1_i5.p1 TRINITY_DN4403_c0_g1~~TRINITY_DN4403_c0_g1_i5.p1  ORF type:complete len:426 (+),score=134.07 TRINITY_DN4403_c0_g1_i5:145-1422(+)